MISSCLVGALMIRYGLSIFEDKPDHDAKQYPPIPSQISHAGRSRQWADAHYVGQILRTGEPMRDHAEGIHEILNRLDVTDELHIAAYLFGYF